MLREVKYRVEPDPRIVESFVLVKGGQLAQDFHACTNIVHTNTRLAPLGHPAAKSIAKLDVLEVSKVFYTLDMKANFHNIPIPAHL